MKVSVEGIGKMAAIGMTEEEASEFLSSDQFRGKVGIAAVNSPGNVTISGDSKQMDEIGEILKERGIFCTFLRINCAYHSHHMIPVGDKLIQLLANLKPGKEETDVPMISSVTGELCKASDLDGKYWVSYLLDLTLHGKTSNCNNHTTKVRNLVSRVRFWPAVEKAMKTFKIDVIVEIGPHPALQGPLRQCLMQLTNQPPPVLPSIIRKEDEQK